MADKLAPPLSLTHEHLLSVLRARLTARPPERRQVRILDVGCGSGELIAYLQQALAMFEPKLEVELFGLDVIDHGVQREGFFADTQQLLCRRFPQIDWPGRLSAITSESPWPFADSFFDIVLSNQVVEHVRDQRRFFAEVARTLRTGGWSVHLFPVRECIIDGHLGLPWVHRVHNFDLLRSYICLCSRLGLGRYQRQSGEAPQLYAERHADYMREFINYPSYGSLLDLVSETGLRGSFRYTPEYYRLKLRSVLRCPDTRHHYREPRSALGDWLLFHALKYVSSITLFLEKQQVYRNL